MQIQEQSKALRYVQAVYDDLLHYEKHSNEFEIEYISDLIDALGEVLTLLDNKEH